MAVAINAKAAEEVEAEDLKKPKTKDQMDSEEEDEEEEEEAEQQDEDAGKQDEKAREQDTKTLQKDEFPDKKKGKTVVDNKVQSILDDLHSLEVSTIKAHHVRILIELGLANNSEEAVHNVLELMNKYAAQEADEDGVKDFDDMLEAEMREVQAAVHATARRLGTREVKPALRESSSSSQ